MSIRIVPEQQPAPIDPETFRADAKVVWSRAGDDHLVAAQRMFRQHPVPPPPAKAARLEAFALTDTNEIVRTR